MQIRKFQGRNMRESIERMRTEIGDEAVILSSQEIEQDGATLTEIVAGIHPEDLAATQQKRKQKKVPDSIRYAAGQALPGREAFSGHEGLKNPISHASMRENYGEFRDEKDILQKISETLSNLESLHRFRFTGVLPEAHRQVYSELRDSGFTEEQSMFYIGNISSRGLGATVEEVRAACKTLIAKTVRTVSPMNMGDGRMVIMVIGSPGSGKTSLCTMIAQSFQLMLQSEVGIYTHGGLPPAQHIVTEPELHRYANIDELAQLLTRGQSEDVSLIEFNHVPTEQMSQMQLEQLIELIQPDAVIVTLPASSHAKRVESWISASKSIKNSSIAITGVDTDRILGDMIMNLAENDVPLSYLTFGSYSPHSLRAASGDLLAERMFSQLI